MKFVESSLNSRVLLVRSPFCVYLQPQKNAMEKLRDYVLPVAIVMGLVFHSYCGLFMEAVPYLIFSILLLNFAAVDMKKMKVTMLDIWLVVFQIVLGVGSYAVLHSLGVNEVIAQGVLAGVLCPVAASVVVVSCVLGANRETVTTFTIVGNLMAVVMIPLCFSYVVGGQEVSFVDTFLMLLRKIGFVIGLPFFIALFFYFVCPQVNGFLSRFKGCAFYFWSFALFTTVGKTIDFIFLNGEGNWGCIIAMAVLSFLFCILQFGVGRWLGGKYGDRVAGGQLMGQKNASMGIWVANTYLLPLASVFLACYSVWQNLFNSWQMWWHDRSQNRKPSKK